MKKTNRNKATFAILIISSIFILSSLVSYASSENITGKYNKKNVLFISSYSPQFSSYDNQLSGLVKGLGENINLQVEYMDYGTFPEAESEINFYNLLKYKINKYDKFDIIILADDHAVNFGKKYREELFKDIPILFLGANDIENAKEAVEFENVYGIIEQVPIEQNIRLISKLYNNKNVVAIIYDKSEKSKELKAFYNLQSQYSNLNFKHISLGDISLSQFEDEINKLNKDDVILAIYSYTEDGNSFIKMMNSIDVLQKNDSIPKYTTLDILSQSNFTGGIITSNYKTSKLAGNIAREMLNGDMPKKKLLYTEDIYASVFDYNEIKKHNIDKSKLPKDSKIFNEPTSFWEKYRGFILPTFIIISCLLITIIVLIKHIKNRIVYEKEILRAKEIAENANKIQSNFISNISHELRTPVAVIMSSNQLLDLNLSKESKEKNQGNINIIRQNCYRLLRIVNNIIDIAKVDSGFMNLQLKNIEIVSLIESLVLSIVPYAKSKNLEVLFDTQEEEIIMSVDPNKIERIILNLLSNAIKFSKKHGQILCNINKENDTLIISIKDNGIGIDKENLDKIFEKFVQVEDTFIRKNEGSGIGLALVKSFVDLHGGSIEVESEVNEGSIFTIKLPIQLLEGESIHICDLDCMQEDSMSTSIEFSDIYT